MFKIALLRFLRKLPIYEQLRETKMGQHYLVKRGKLVTYDQSRKILDEAPNLLLNDLNEKNNLYVGVVRSTLKSGLIPTGASWLRYERFLIYNKIKYDFIDIKKSTWMEEVAKFDIILWHTNSTPSEKYEAESKIYIIDKILNKECFPNFHEIWQYEDKVRAHYLYRNFNLPEIPSFTSNSLEEVSQEILKMEYPFISKTRIGAGSLGVIKVKSPNNALNRVKKIFSKKGLKSSFPTARQHEYVLFQNFIDDATFDLRIIIVGQKAFGYYRYPKKGDFRASGAGVYEKKEIPNDALQLAHEVKEKLKSRLLGVDLMYSNKLGKYLIIEASLFNQIDSPSQLEVDGISGYYDLSTPNYEFKEGKFWIQELLLKEVVSDWYCKSQKKKQSC